MTSLTDRPSGDISDALRETAALWHERMRGDQVHEDMRAAFDRWMAESVLHRQVYAEIEQTWSMLGQLPEAAPMLALRHETALRLTRRTARKLRPWRALAAASTLLLAGAAAYLMASHASNDTPLVSWVERVLLLDRGDHYVTGTGERLAFTLQDGSQVMLDTQSELDVAFTNAERHVTLRRGQAFFEVAKNPSRPFVVEARDRRVEAVGTAFDVRLDASELKVTMVEGVVRVASATLKAGQELVVDRQSRERIVPADPEHMTSWRRGELIFQDTRLADAVAEVNRYSQLKISIADPALDEVRISGAFVTGHSTSFVEAITGYFRIEAGTSGDTVVLRARR